LRDQPLPIAILIGIMCAYRLGLPIVAYIEPVWLMEYFGCPPTTNLQMPYIIRVWAIRDIVLSILIVSARGNIIKALLWACVAVDATDVLSAQISGASGLFNAANTWSLTIAAVAALVPEIAALALIYRRELPKTT
jgi:hypothetical protein